MNDLILCTGCGRDGTNSLALLIGEIFKQNNHAGTSTHQLNHRKFYNALHDNYEDRDTYKAAIQKILAEWKLGDAVVGNGYAASIPVITKHFNDQVKLIHVKRDKESWVASFKKNIETYPQSHGNYSSSDNPSINRMAAFHFGECTRGEWDSWNLDKKLSWYYDKTHTLIEAAGKHMPYLIVQTENISKLETAKSIAQFINPNWNYTGPSVRVNVSYLDFAQFTQKEQKILGRIYSTFDFVRAANNPRYGESFFANLIRKGFENREKYEHSTVSTEDFKTYIQEIKTRINEFEKTLQTEDE